MGKRTFDEFDDFANGYRDLHNQNIKISGADSFYFAEMKVKFLQQFETDRPLKVLDIGCGDGATEFFMLQYFPKWKITGLDVSKQSIKVAQEKNLPNSIFSEYDGTNFPLKDESVDIVFIAGVFHHVSFDLHLQLMTEIVRVLGKDGKLFLFEQNPNNPLTKYLVNTCVFDKDARLLKSTYAEKLLKKGGVKIVKKMFIIFFPRNKIFSKFIFLEKYLQWLPLGGQYFIFALKSN